jgi:hypothetical protein
MPLQEIRSKNLLDESLSGASLDAAHSSGLRPHKCMHRSNCKCPFWMLGCGEMNTMFCLGNVNRNTLSRLLILTTSKAVKTHSITGEDAFNLHASHGALLPPCRLQTLYKPVYTWVDQGPSWHYQHFAIQYVQALQHHGAGHKSQALVLWLQSF